MGPLERGETTIIANKYKCRACEQMFQQGQGMFFCTYNPVKNQAFICMNCIVRGITYAAKQSASEEKS